MLTNRIAYLGFVLILLGVLALVYGGVGYTKQEQLMELGSFEADVEMLQKVRVPLWGSGVFLVAGIVLVAVGLRKR